MIIKGNPRAGSRQLGHYLDSPGQNERIQALEVTGTVARDIPGAILEMDAYAAGTRCEKPLYHAKINPEPPYRLTEVQCREAVDALGERLGLAGQPRVVVLHEKEGRQHLHVVWARVDTQAMRTISYSHNFRKHEEVARDLERRFEHPRVQGAHAEREDKQRPDRSPSRAERAQEERTGITGKMVKQEVTAAFKASDGAEAFKAALEEKGYLLAQGDRRDFVIIDRLGGVHSLARRIDGMNASELREYMAPIDRANLPTIGQAKEIVKHRAEVRKSHMQAAKEKSYGRGDDYVSQSQAASKDHKKRQEALNRPGTTLASKRAKIGNDPRTRDTIKTEQVSKSSKPDWRANRIDRKTMTDAQREKFGRQRDRTEDDVGRQHEAPDGGHTRSR